MTVIETDLEFEQLNQRHVTDLIVIHHIGDIDRDVSAEEIHQWHKNQGWSGIGYHYVVRKDGSIERGRPRNSVGAHAQGFNSRSIGINVVGDFEQGEPNNEQIEAVSSLIAELCNIYDITPTSETVVGHRDLMPTTCPGENLYSILQDIRGKAIWYKENG